MTRNCRYRADLPCTYPHLMCPKCPHYERDTYVPLVPAGSGVTSVFSKVPDPCPYVKFVTPSGRPGIEVGVKGTF